MHPGELKAPAEAYLQALKIRNLSKDSLRHIGWKLNHFLDYLTSRDITHVDQISAALMQAYQIALSQKINRHGRPNSVAYQNGLLATARQFVAFLAQNDYILSDPGGRLAYAKAPQRLPRSVLTPAEARKIIHAPETTTVIGYRDRTILELLYSSGIRSAEVNNLTLADVDYHDGFLRIIQGKGRKDRIVPIGAIACRYLENYISAVRPALIRNPYDQHLFLTIRGKRFSKNALWSLIKKYAKKARLKKNVHPHTFRHSCATAMLKNKADLNTIRKLLGHRSLTATQVYTHLAITDLKDEHKRCHPREKDPQ